MHLPKVSVRYRETQEDLTEKHYHLRTVHPTEKHYHLRAVHKEDVYAKSVG